MTDYLASFDKGYSVAFSILFFFLCACFGAGRGLLCFSGPEIKDAGRRFFISAALGININGIILYVFSFAGRFNLLFSYLALGAGAAAGIYFIIREKYYIPRRPRYAVALPVVVFAFFASSSLCYPAGWDELVYHISLPLRWSAVNFPEFFKDNPFSAFPSMAEITFWKLICAGGIKMPRLLCFSVTIFSFYGLYLLLKPGLTRMKTFVLIFSVALSPVMLMLLREVYVESFILLNILAALMIIRRKTDNPAAVALLAGGCAALKLTGFAAAFVILVIWAFTFLRREHGLRNFIRSAVIFAIVSGLTVFIFYLRPFIQTGNPFYPYFSSVFGGSDAALLAGDFHYLTGSMKYGVTTAAGFFMNPAAAALSGDVFDGSFGLQGAFLWLSLLVSVFFIIRKKLLISYRAPLLIYPALLIYAIWFFSSQQMRFLVPLLFLCVVDFKYNLRLAAGRRFRMSIVLFLFVLSLFSIPAGAAGHFMNCWRYLLGGRNLEDYLYSSTGEGYLQSVAAVKSFAGHDRKYLILFERRGLYYPGKYELATPFFQEKYFTPVPASSAEMMKILRENKVEFVLAGHPRKHPDRLPGFEEKLIPLYFFISEARGKKELLEIWNCEGYILYKLTSVER